ncbi:ArnT family glycosyltransferase [Lacrimispora sp.]|uniref:ArnT family glycosyltransferase n=1 Tax=Lacrimispora sp. TaxID=2719234 RepID=UPI00285B4A45|nr:hypothetical protein [Lacrimispora sp.]MDR7814994.1 hypothetical protein [Lacrimispora sp.]
MLKTSSNKTKFLLIMLFLFSILSTLWMLDLKNSFTFDDFTTLYNARFNSFEELFNVLPTRTYNDRPIGLMFIKSLNILFGLNFQAYHIIFAFIHYFNIFLIYKIACILFDSIVGEEKKYLSIIAASVFGIYPLSIMSVSWISAVYDLLCCLFVLLSIVFYLKARASERYEHNYAIISLVCFYLSIRTKEMSLTLPLILGIYEIWLALKMKTKLKINWYLMVSIIIMFLFVFLLFGGGIEDIGPDNPYYQDFGVFNLLRNAVKYLFLYFDWSNAEFIFHKYSAGAIIGVLFFVVLFLYALYLAIKKRDYSIIFLIFCIGISLSVVLTMVNMQHRLYLYIPSIFIGITISTFICKILKTKMKYLWEISLVIILGLYLINFMPGMIGYKLQWLNFCYNDAQGLKQLERIEKPVDQSSIYVKGAKDTYNIFYYGPGNSLRILFDDPSINVFLVEEFPEEPVKPYVLLKYNNDNIIEVERDMNIPAIEIESVYPEQINGETDYNEDGTLNLAIVSNIINDNLKIVINGTELNTTIGTDFISTVVPQALLDNEYWNIQVYDTKDARLSDAVTLKIDLQ